ncbi:MAG: AAA family ATPase [Bryobacterales bacterium]|nr:AAA family ATPase [Bryobacterales bacterium]
MRFIPRAIQPAVLEAACAFPAVVVTGPRRAGKTTLLRRLFPRAFRSQSVAGRTPPPALFDEIRNMPELFADIRTRIDRNPRQMGRWLFTGSQDAPLMRGVAQSMAGRAAILQLPPFSLAETDRVELTFPRQPWCYNRRTKHSEFYLDRTTGIEYHSNPTPGTGALRKGNVNVFENPTLQPG